MSHSAFESICKETMKFGAALLVCLVTCGCSPETPTTGALVAHIAQSGIVMGKPAGRAAQDLQNMETAVKISGGGSKPGVEFHESGKQVLLTVYRFARQDDAARFKPILDNMKNQLKLPDRFKDALGDEEIVLHGPFIVSLRYSKENEDEKNTIVKAIADFP